MPARLGLTGKEAPPAVLIGGQEPPAYVRLCPALVALLALAFLSVRIGQGMYLGDEGVACMDAWRLSSGEVPGRDFFQIIPPLSAGLLACAFTVLGASVFASRLVAWIYGALLIALAFRASALLTKKPGPQSLALAFLVPFGVGAWPIPSHHWAVDIFLLGTFLALSRHESARAPAWFFCGGVLAGLSALCLQDQGGYAVIFITLLFVLPSRGWRKKRAWAWAAGLLLVGLAAACLLSRASLSGLWYDWVLFPSSRYRALQGGLLAGGAGWRQALGDVTRDRWETAPLLVTLSLLAYGLLFLMPWAALASAAAALWKKWLPRPDALLLLAFVLAFVAGAGHRWSIMNLVWISPMLALGAALLSDRAWDVPNVWLRRGARAFALAAMAILIGLGILVLLQESRARPSLVTSARGALQVSSTGEARRLQAFLDAVDRMVPPGAPAFCWGYVPMVNFMTGHPNPTRFSILITSPPYNTEAQVEEWKRTLDAKGIEWGFSHAFKVSEGDPVAAYLSRSFHPFWTNGAYTLWKRASPVEDSPRPSGSGAGAPS